MGAFSSKICFLSSSVLLLLVFSNFSVPTSASAAFIPRIAGTIHVRYDGGFGVPQYIAYDPSNKFMYVANTGFYCPTPQGCNASNERSKIAVIDTLSNKVIALVPVGYGADDIIYNPSNKEVYVVNILNDTVSVLKNTKVVATIVVGPQCFCGQNLLYDPSNNLLYVGNTDSVSAINGSTNTVVATIKVAGGAQSLTYDAANHEIYVATVFGASDTVSVIRGTKVVASVIVGPFLESMMYDPANKEVYAMSEYNISMINSFSNTVIATIQMPRGIIAEVIGYDQANKEVYVGGANDVDVAQVFVISVFSHTVVATIDLSGINKGRPGPFLNYIKYSPGDRNMYVSAEDLVGGGGAGFLAVLSSTTDSVVTGITSMTLPYPLGLAYDPVSTKMYVVYPTANAVALIASD